jgi:hypothetical protein
MKSRLSMSDVAVQPAKAAARARSVTARMGGKNMISSTSSLAEKRGTSKALRVAEMKTARRSGPFPEIAADD